MIWVLTQTFNAWFDSVPESYLNIETSTNTQNWPTSQIVASLISPHFLVVFYSPSIIILNSTIKNFLILHQVFLKFFTSLVRPHLIFGTFNLGLPPHFCIFLKNDSTNAKLRFTIQTIWSNLATSYEFLSLFSIKSCKTLFHCIK